VIVRIQFAGQGRVSGLSFDAPVFQVLTFRDGEIVSVEDFSGARTRSVQPAADRGAES
jgi:ketosteroid isomerase-like protein